MSLWHGFLHASTVGAHSGCPPSTGQIFLFGWVSIAPGGLDVCCHLSSRLNWLHAPRLPAWPLFVGPSGCKPTIKKKKPLMFYKSWLRVLTSLRYKGSGYLKTYPWPKRPHQLVVIRTSILQGDIIWGYFIFIWALQYCQVTNQTCMSW